MSALKLAIRFAGRELRSGLAGFRIFLASLTLGVAAVAGVGSLGQAFLVGLSEKGQVLLGGDVRMERQSQPADDQERAFMAGFGSVAEIATLRSMASDPRKAESRALVEMKAVDPLYPLVGQMELMPAMPLGAALACDQKQCGMAVEDALLARLDVRLGDVVHIGDADFVIRARIVSEPDRVIGGFSLGPRVMVSHDALKRAGLIVEGSFISYSYKIVFSGETSPQAFRAAEQSAFPNGRWEINDRTNAIPRVTRFVDQATMFLTLIALTALIVGGVGAGLYGMLVFVLLTVFIAGLMVGRTPEYLGKKIEAREMKLAMLYVLIFPLLILSFSAWAAVVPYGTSSLANPGPHGLSEVLYAFASGAGNNGSAFAGLNANTRFYNLALGFDMLAGRFLMIVPALGIAGSMVDKKVIPAGPGTFPTTGALFVALLVAVVLIVGALTFFPALSLGPLVEHFAGRAGRLF